MLDKKKLRLDYRISFFEKWRARRCRRLTDPLDTNDLQQAKFLCHLEFGTVSNGSSRSHSGEQSRVDSEPTRVAWWRTGFEVTVGGFASGGVLARSVRWVPNGEGSFSPGRSLDGGTLVRKHVERLGAQLEISKRVSLGTPTSRAGTHVFAMIRAITGVQTCQPMTLPTRFEIILTRLGRLHRSPARERPHA